MSKKYNLKKIDAITALLWSFIFFIILLFLYLNEINKNLQRFSTNDDVLNELIQINHEFDNFLLQQAVFTNYDEINRKNFKFNEGIEFLMDKDNSNITSMQYNKIVQNVKNLYELKTSSLEYFKSESSQLLYSMHYLFDLNSAISKSTSLDKILIDRVNKTLLTLSKHYINPSINSSKLVKNLEYLNLNAKNSELIEMFVKHAKINIKRIERFNEIKSSQEIDKTVQSLEELHTFLHNDYSHNIFIEKTIIISLFIVALIILFVLIVMNRRSLRMRDKLLGFKAAIENSYNSIVITDFDKNITYVNEITEKQTGYSKDELIGQNPRVLKSGLNNEIFYQELHDSLEAGKKWEGEFINKKKDGSLFYEKASIMPIFQDDELVNYLAIKLNITDYINEKERVEYMAYHDSLTSLPNRINVEKYLKQRLPIAKRNNSKIAILFIDLDRFKTINDTLGHDVGDELLIECALRLKAGLRETDMLARVGGDEFIIVIEALSTEYSAAHLCEKILKLFNKPVQTQEHLLNITLSIGVSIFPDDDNEDYKKLFKYADIAMYKAKESGKNTYKYYQTQLSLDVHNRLDIEQSLKVALKNSELYMMYQPKYNIADKAIIGLEALVRWENKKLGLVPPDKFIPIAEDTGFIIDIGLFIFEQSCRDFLIFKEFSKTLNSISINISAVQLYQDSFTDDIMKIIKDVEISPYEITLEITETHIMKNIQHSMKLLKDLKELGFNISIDDFGTGHSSLSYLKLFPIDELKIDKSFVDDLPHDKNDVAISKAIITLSKSMGYINVAEGIENEAQEQFLQGNNCSIGQGYYFCRPKTKDNLIEFFKD